VTVPPASKAFIRTAESVTEPPVRIEEAERLVVIDGCALRAEMEIIVERDNEPSVPVTVTVNVVLAEDLQDIAEVPEPAMLMLVSVQESPVVGDVATVRATVPANPLTPVSVKVEFPVAPTVTLSVAGLAATVKSWTTKVTVVTCDFGALVPVTPTWTVDAKPKVHESVPLPDPVTLVGETVHEVLFVAKLTTPAKPLRGVTVKAEVPVAPTFRATDAGFAATVKSVTMNDTLVERDKVPLVPVIGTV